MTMRIPERFANIFEDELSGVSDPTGRAWEIGLTASGWMRTGKSLPNIIQLYGGLSNLSVHIFVPVRFHIEEVDQLVVTKSIVTDVSGDGARIQEKA
ncbi:hypothetical protein SADUNF_Sadunf04G0097400 [Salix dunnii]|uniref:Uncharacterized protein n=1 Tax=Salix dunnii TaxID=1413687 RepID=A0A835KE31_9ROSI|nr:hypothetical protein SADUNF_Sadunf04G0097400 [Salix dunnii]